MIGLDDIRAAADRIAPHVRRTPVIEVAAAAQPPTPARLLLKLESLQVTGSFKARGATNKLLSLPPAAVAGGIVTASGGNHGLAVARAARMAGVAASIHVPAAATAEKRAKLRRWGATVSESGTTWNEAHAVATAEARQRGCAYFHPFADPAVVAGQGTVALELLRDAPEIDTLLVAIGGGGLIAGMAVAVRALRPDIRIIGIEPVGAPTLHACLAAGSVVRLPELTSRVATMSCAETDPQVFDLIRSHVDEIVLIEDRDMEEAAGWLWFEFGIAADLSGAAAIAALRAGRVTLAPGAVVAGLVCGAGLDGTAP